MDVFSDNRLLTLQNIPQEAILTNTYRWISDVTIRVLIIERLALFAVPAHGVMLAVVTDVSGGTR